MARKKKEFACEVGKRSLRCVMYTWFHKLCSSIALALMEEQKRATENETTEFIKAREQQETLKGEWHRTPENVDKILRILERVYGDTNTYMVAHHILIQPIGSAKAWEIPSFESMVFDQEFLGRCSQDTTTFARELSYMEKQERLDYLYTHICTDTTIISTNA